MCHFCFNECFPISFTDDEVITSFQNSIKEYSILKKKYGDKITGILTDRLPEKIPVTLTLTLHQAITLLDRDYRITALTNFNKYPIDFFLKSDDDELLEGNFFINVGEEKFDGINAQISFLNNGILFSFGLHDDIRKDEITIYQENKLHSAIRNLFGHTTNTASLILSINNHLAQSLDGFAKFLNIFSDPIYFKSLKSDFESFPLNCQNAIIDGFSQAVLRKLNTNFASDGKLIKDVTPEKEKNVQVYELRIFVPVAIRIYFYEKGNRIYLAKIKKKPSKKTQSNDIKVSNSLIKELIKLH